MNMTMIRTTCRKSVFKGCLFAIGMLLTAVRMGAQEADSGWLLRLTTDKRVKVEQFIKPEGRVKDIVVTDRYSETAGVGYDFTEACASGTGAARFVSVNVPDGNYRITVLIGNRKQAGFTTIRAESRRLFVNDMETKAGQFKTCTFVTNKRTPRISDDETVALKSRERGKLNWDDKLTIEINGRQPQCAAILIEREKDAPTVFLAGNSTVVDQDNEPWASWGQMIPLLFNDSVCFANYAESGESLESFIAEKRLKKMVGEMKEGDYLFIEFGHNDQKIKGSGKGAHYSFATNLKYCIDEARGRGAIPVLLTPTCRRFFEDGRVKNTHGDYPEAVRDVAAREGVALIDLQEMTRTLYEALGEEGSKRAFVHYPAGTYPGQDKDLADNTHFNPYGAYEIARCVVEGMRTATPALTAFLREGATSFNPAVPDETESFHWDGCPKVELEKPDGN